MSLTSFTFRIFCLSPLPFFMATPPVTPTRATTAGHTPQTPKEREPANPVGTRPNPSSPLKSAPIRVHSRRDAQASTVALPHPDPEFVSKHLSNLPPNFGGQFRDCVEAIQQVGKNSLKMAAPLAELLTRYSESAYSMYLFSKNFCYLYFRVLQKRLPG